MPGYALLTPKVVSVPVRPGAEVLARRGAMLGYKGDVRFTPVSGLGGGPGGPGIAGALGQRLAGESVALMVCEGYGDVYYGWRGLHLTLLHLRPGELLSVEADRLLCHDAVLQRSTTFLGQGGVRQAIRGAVTGQGLFTTQLAGDGAVALLAHGGTLELPVTPQRPVVVDPQAYVAHAGPVQIDVSARVGWREAVGRGSGEAIQLRMSGHGTVYVQASEEKA